MRICVYIQNICNMTWTNYISVTISVCPNCKMSFHWSACICLESAFRCIGIPIHCISPTRQFYSSICIHTLPCDRSTTSLFYTHRIIVHRIWINSACIGCCTISRTHRHSWHNDHQTNDHKQTGKQACYSFLHKSTP